MGWKLDRIVHAEVWATETIPADLPLMIKFKAKADAIIKARWGIQVEHVQSRMFNVGAMMPWMDYTPRTLDQIELLSSGYKAEAGGIPIHSQFVGKNE